MERQRVWGAYAALCMLAGSGWMVDEWRKPVLAGPLGAAVHLGVLAVLFYIAGSRVKHAGERHGGGRWLRVGFWGALLFGLPPVVTAAAGGAVSTFTEVLVFALVPVMVLVMGMQGTARFGPEENPLRLLPGALAGVGGMALVLPFSLPGSVPGWLWLAAIFGCAVASAVSAMKLHGLLEELDLRRATALICAAAAGATVAGSRAWPGIGTWSATNATVETARFLLVDGPVMFLTVWLLRELSPNRIAARYLLIPLVTIVEGYLVLRPELTWTLAAGLLLVAAGGMSLLRADQEDTQRAFESSA